MTDSYRPVTAAGVKSTLKGLRTRAGLQAERLATTELALDTLDRDRPDPGSRLFG
jgi:hypothetical protein